MQRLSAYGEAVDEAIRRVLHAEPRYQGLYDMVRYHHGWLDSNLHPIQAPPGKKLRPSLCLLMADSLLGYWQHAVPGAAAIEMVHNFSLIHDDIQDQSPLRRHRETVWVRWNVGQGITAGDALLILAEQCLIDPDPPAPPALRLGSLRMLNSACSRLCEGQYLDLLWETEPSVTVDDYLQMIEGKTARLFQCAAEMGAFCSRADEEMQLEAARYGAAMGMAFQAVDDWLGVWGEEAVTGKTSALDVTTRKKALPAVLALSRPPSPEVERLSALYAQQRLLTPEETHEATALIEQLGAHDETVEWARRYRDESLEHLAALGKRFDVSALREFTDTVLPAL
jgi:geranylgeranyl diphosphate synthase, type I